MSHAEFTYDRERVEKLTANVETLKAELKDSTELQTRQEGVIKALKEESAVLSEVTNDLRELKKKSKRLQADKDEQHRTILELRKVNYFLHHRFTCRISLSCTCTLLYYCTTIRLYVELYSTILQRSSNSRFHSGFLEK